MFFIKNAFNVHHDLGMKKHIITCLLMVAFFEHAFSQTPKPILSLADSSVNVFLGANLKTTMLLSNRRLAPSTGTAYLLLPKDGTGVEGTFDLNARASTIYLAAEGPKLGSFNLGTKMVFYVIRDLTDPAYGLLPAMMYVDMKNDQWRFAVGQQEDVFSERIPNMIDGYFALASSGCVGNSSRGQLRATRFIESGKKSKLSITLAASQPVSTYFSKDLKNNSENNGVPNVEWALKFETGKDTNAIVPFDAVELGISGITGSYRVFKNDTSGGTIVNNGINIPQVNGICGEFAFRIGKVFGIQGEVYVGQALGNYLGTIMQTTKGENDKEIRSMGFWVEAAYYWKKNLQSRFGYGQDECNKEDLLGNGVWKNSTYFGNVIWDINKTISTGIELTHKSTQYLSLNDNQGMTYMWMFQYSF
jgi:hypothetical protein